MIPLYALVLAGPAGVRALLAGQAGRVERKFVPRHKASSTRHPSIHHLLSAYNTAAVAIFIALSRSWPRQSVDL
jgi:superfamily II DNA or RNA helicase